jgi:hypothetical protein
MADRIQKKRGPGGASLFPQKRRKKQRQYHSGSESDAGDDVPRDAEKHVGGETTEFTAVNLLDSDDDIENAKVDQGESGSASSSEHEEIEAEQQVLRKAGWQVDSEDEEDDLEEEEESDAASEGASPATDAAERTVRSSTKSSKRNDPNAFATSLSKILSTKLSSSRRDDPLLARSAAAQEASRAAADQALETKARRKVREQKRMALERGRVRDVMLAVQPEDDGANGKGMRAMTAAEVADEERRLRKVAQRGVVRLFNAVRAAQSTRSDRGEEGVVGMARKEQRANEMSRKGFLELIASGGGGLSKKPLEEA